MFSQWYPCTFPMCALQTWHVHMLHINSQKRFVQTVANLPSSHFSTTHLNCIGCLADMFCALLPCRQAAQHRVQGRNSYVASLSRGLPAECVTVGPACLLVLAASAIPMLHLLLKLPFLGF